MRTSTRRGLYRLAFPELAILCLIHFSMQGQNVPDGFLFKEFEVYNGGKKQVITSYQLSLNNKKDTLALLTDIAYYDENGRLEYTYSEFDNVTEKIYSYSDNGDTVKIISGCRTILSDYTAIKINHEKGFHIERTDCRGSYSEDVSLRKGKVWKILQYAEPDHILVQKWKANKRNRKHFVINGGILYSHERIRKGKTLWIRRYENDEVRVLKDIIYDYQKKIISSTFYKERKSGDIDIREHTVQTIRPPRQEICYIFDDFILISREVISFDKDGNRILMLEYDNKGRLISGHRNVYRNW